MMDHTSKENRSSTIWDKFESVAPGIPDWVRQKEQTGVVLQALLKTLPAQAILITTTSEIFLQSGDLDAQTQQKILQILDAFWDPNQKSDLTRYLKNRSGDVTGFIYSADLFQDLILTLYYPDTPTLSIAKSHAKRIIRALSGQTIASYAAKTVPVDAAIAAQMRKFFEQNVLPPQQLEDPAGEALPLPEQSIEIDAETLIDFPSESMEMETQPADSNALDELMPNLDDLLGDGHADLPIDLPGFTEPPNPLENNESGLADEETLENVITEEDLAKLADELDTFFEDDDNAELNLQEQKEKLASILKEMPSPDPIKEEPPTLEAEQSTDFVLPWELEQPASQPTEPVMEPDRISLSEPDPPSASPEIAETLLSADPISGPEPAPDFQAVFQQVQAEPAAEKPIEDRLFTLVIIPRIAFHALGQSFEDKFSQYVQQTSQVLSCSAEGCSVFSDHIQLKIKLSGKASIVRTTSQLKSLLETKILENYATFKDELGGQTLWWPGQLIFNEHDKLDNRRINAFIRSTQQSS